jgi:N6-L-threonylcarbamoyladenine synthase
MLILGIETSCDDTAASVVQNGRQMLSNVVYTQLIHSKYGGIVPEIASRGHMKHLNTVVRSALSQANVDIHELEGIAVTQGPGLVGSLIVGISFSKSLAWTLNIPLMGINHLEGHIFAYLLTKQEAFFPFIALVVSGGHSEITLVQDFNKYHVLGRTRDDAAGEAFDKVAKLAGLPYPGGPSVEKAAMGGDSSFKKFPRAYLEPDSFDFSFSGLKTAFRNYVMDNPGCLQDERRKDVLASFQESVVEVLTEKTVRAAVKYKVKYVVLGGGVVRNQQLKERFENKAKENRLTVVAPSPSLCTDNAAMIAAMGYYHYQTGLVSSPHLLDACPNLTLV